VSGSKKQLELIRAFSELCKQYPEDVSGWRLILVGGSTPGNNYLESLLEAVAELKCPIEIVPNAAVSEIKEFYRRAAIFWHACGLDETKPERVEHFGMTTVEAMQNYCVPIVIDGGGQREIVQHGDSGFRFSTLEELKSVSLAIIGDKEMCQRMAEQAFSRSQLFSQEVFKDKFQQLLDDVELELLGRDSLPRIQARA